MDVSSFSKADYEFVYYVLAIAGSLYGFYKFVKYQAKNSEWFNLLKLITEVPSTIVEIKKGQEQIATELKLQNKFINAILETLELAQFLCDADGKCIKVNSKWISLTGLSEEEAKGHHWLLSIHFEDRDKVQQKWYHMIHDNTPFEEVFRYQHRVTRAITKVKCTANDVIDEEGKRIFIIGLSRIL
jgi:PAS domain S-box-containing protein